LLRLFSFDILISICIQLQNVTVNEGQRKMWTPRYSLRRWICYVCFFPGSL